MKSGNDLLKSLIQKIESKLLDGSRKEYAAQPADPVRSNMGTQLFSVYRDFVLSIISGDIAGEMNVAVAPLLGIFLRSVDDHVLILKSFYDDDMSRLFMKINELNGLLRDSVAYEVSVSKTLFDGHIKPKYSVVLLL